MPIQDQLPKSRITLVYRTNISGQEEEVNLPFRVLVMGDFSKGSSVDRHKDGKDVDLDARNLRSVTGNNLNELMKDMGMTLKFEGEDAVDDKIGGDGDGKMEFTLPITSMKSFHPDEIVKHVPKLRALMLMRKLLVEMQADIDNKKPVRQQLHTLYSDKAKRDALIAATTGDLKTFAALKLPDDPDTVAAAAEAATAATAAATAADAAKAAADAAKTAADAAKAGTPTKAAATKTAADNAASAKTAADDAKKAADAAKAAADAALKKPSAEAKKAAAEAKKAADDAKAVADAAKAKADAAKAKADAAT